MGAMLCARVGKSIAGMARSYSAGGEGAARGLFVPEKLWKRCRSAPWARCFAHGWAKSIAGMARSYSAGGEGAARGLFMQEKLWKRCVGAPSGRDALRAGGQEHRGHGPLLQRRRRGGGPWALHAGKALETL